MGSEIWGRLSITRAAVARSVAPPTWSSAFAPAAVIVTQAGEKFIEFTQGEFDLGPSSPFQLTRPVNAPPGTRRVRIGNLTFTELAAVSGISTPPTA